MSPPRCGRPAHGESPPQAVEERVGYKRLRNKGPVQDHLNDLAGDRRFRQGHGECSRERTGDAGGESRWQPLPVDAPWFS